MFYFFHLHGLTSRLQNDHWFRFAVTQDANVDLWFDTATVEVSISSSFGRIPSFLFLAPSLFRRIPYSIATALSSLTSTSALCKDGLGFLVEMGNVSWRSSSDILRVRARACWTEIKRHLELKVDALMKNKADTSESKPVYKRHTMIILFGRVGKGKPKEWNGR